MKNLTPYLFSLSLLLLMNCGGTDSAPGSPEHISSVTKKVDSDRLILADSTPEDWLTYG